MDSEAWNERYRAVDLVWGSEPNQFVRRLCERLPIGHALDLACGEGRNALWLARLGWRVIGVDYSAVAIERAKALSRQQPSRVADRIIWRVADITADKPRPRSADLVLISYVHLSTEQRGDLMRSAALAVKPGGYLVVVGHDRRNLDEGVGGPQDRDLLYAPDDLAHRLVGTGLVVELAETVQRQSEQGVALDTVLQSRRPREDT
ncbi:MAG: class I SAM-dependent methyltransferase [Nocardioidaceae bacterium]|nr:class I SAM-dependent methyltransferase [Nocardioidaceae bacterium]